MTIARAFSILVGMGLAACGGSGGEDGADENGTTGESSESSESGESSEPDLPGSSSYALFLAGPVDGNLVAAGMGADGASSANALCVAERAASWSELECGNVSALLSSASGPITAAVLTLGLDPQREVFVAQSGLSVGTVADVLNGVMSMSLVNAGAFADDVETGLWTGTDNEGKYGLACSDWSTAEMSMQGLTGNGDVADPWWSGGSAACSAQRRILCLCH